MLENGSTSLLDSHERRLEKVEQQVSVLSGLQVKVDLVNSGVSELKDMVSSGFSKLTDDTIKINNRVIKLEDANLFKSRLYKIIIGFIGGLLTLVGERVAIHSNLFH